MVQQLRYQLGVVPHEVPVAWDEEGPPARNHDRVWRNCRRAWEMHDPGADWHLVLQDDAVVCRDLLAGIARGLNAVPEQSIVSLYMGTTRPLPRLWTRLAQRAHDEGASWCVGPRSVWGIALALPVELIGQMLDYCDHQGSVPDDMRIGRWARKNRLEAWFPWPSLVDHAPGPSLVGHHLERSAHRLLEGSALRDWDAHGHVVRHYGV